MNKRAYTWQTSFFKTLAHKHRQSVHKMTARLKDLRHPTPGRQGIDIPPNTLRFTLSRSELIHRLNARQCEYCETRQGPFEVHHIRKLKDIEPGKTIWQRMMIARRRKTLILCQSCHHLLHAGTLPDRDYRKRQVKGE